MNYQEQNKKDLNSITMDEKKPKLNKKEIVVKQPKIYKKPWNGSGTSGYGFDKGVSGNPAGRPKGSTMKEYVAQKFRSMTPQEKDEWLATHLVTSETLWKMAEGNPDNKNTLVGAGDEPLFNDEHKSKSRGAIKQYLNRGDTGEGK